MTSVNAMTIWDVMDEYDRLKNKDSKRGKELRVRMDAVDAAYKKWDKVTPLSINKI